MPELSGAVARGEADRRHVERRCRDERSRASRQAAIAESMSRVEAALTSSNPAQALACIRQHLDSAIVLAASDVNRLAAQIATLNTALFRARTVSEIPDGLHDRMRLTLRCLSDLVNVDVAQQGDGPVDVTFGSRRPLVLGGSAISVTTTQSIATRDLALAIGAVVVTGDITSGRIGGLLYARDRLIPQYQWQVDQRAHRRELVHGSGVHFLS